MAKAQLANLETIRSAIESAGYYHCSSPQSFETFSSIARELGTVTNESTIQLVDGIPRYFTSPGPVPIHTDGAARIVGWWCVEGGKGTEPALLVDLHPIKEELTEDELDVLSTVTSRLRGYGPESKIHIPVFSSKGFYFGPWGITKSSMKTDEKAKVVQKFMALVKEHERSQRVEIPIATGCFHFIDNYRMAHSRDKIDADSRRTLHRIWID